MVVATAQRAQAAYIVTRDKDLLSLQRYGDITMITPRRYSDRAERRETEPMSGHRCADKGYSANLPILLLLSSSGVCVAAERICAAAHICSVATQPPIFSSLS